MSYIFSFCVLIYFKEQIFFIFTVPLFNVKKIEETSFILNNPIQLIETHVLICLCFSFLILVPIVIVQIFWFVSSGASIVENKKTKKIINIFCFNYFIITFILISFIFPLLWLIFEYLSQKFIYLSYLNIEYEPNFANYFFFLFHSIKNIQIFLIVYIYLLFMLLIIPIKNYIININLINIVLYTLIFFSFSLNFLTIEVCISIFIILVLFDKCIYLNKILKYKKLLYANKKKNLFN